MIRRAILSALSSACHGAGEAFANLMPKPTVDAAAVLDWGAQSLFGLAGVVRRCCEEPDAQPAEEERAEMVEKLRAMELAGFYQLEARKKAEAERDMAREGLMREREAAQSTVAELEEKLRTARAEHDDLVRRISVMSGQLHASDSRIVEQRREIDALEAQLFRASHWKRGEPGEPRRLVVRWNAAHGEPTHDLSTNIPGRRPLVPGWYAEALGAPPSEDAPEQNARPDYHGRDYT